MAEIANHAKEPWPSLDWATWIFDRASWVLVVSLIIGAAATIAIVWMGIVKEHHWDLARELAASKIAELNKDAAAARLETAKIKERISWRELSPSQLQSITSMLAGPPLQIILWHLSTDPEAANLYFQLKEAFVAADGVQIGPDDDRALINSGVPRYGILLGGRKDDVERMKKALDSAELEITSIDIRDDVLNVWIGTKPRPK